MNFWQQAGVVLAVVSTAVLILKELYTTFWVNRKKDKQALDVARAQSPEIMKQLELGNFKQAAEGIAIAQSFVQDQLKYAQVELVRLREREVALEAEAEGWERRYQERDEQVRKLEAKVSKLDGKIEALQHMLEQCQREMRRNRRVE